MAGMFPIFYFFNLRTSMVNPIFIAILWGESFPTHLFFFPLISGVISKWAKSRFWVHAVFTIFVWHIRKKIAGGNKITLKYI